MQRVLQAAIRWGLLLAAIAVTALAGGCAGHEPIVVYHAAQPPNPNLIFGSDGPVLPPRGYLAARRYAYYADTLPPAFFPGAVDFFAEYTYDYRRTPHQDRFRQRAYGLRTSALYR